VFYLLGTAISVSDARYLLTALGALGTPEALDAAEKIALGMTGRRDPVPLSAAMRDAVSAALSDDPPPTLVELRIRATRKNLVVKEW